MGLLRGRNDGGTRYQLREKVFSIGDDLWIGTEHDDRAYKVNGKALRIRRTLVIESPHGDELFKIQERVLSVRDAMKIERGGDTIATVKHALVGIRSRYHVNVEGGDDLRAQGNFVDHEYKVERDGKHVAEVSKRWFSIRDTYGIDVATGEDAAFVIAIVICIDEMARG
jgi:uncharacterized protein YxjI